MWRVSGRDDRGSFTGLVELRKGDDGSVRFARTVAYDAVSVEDGRALHLAWTGSVARLGADGAALSASLDPRGFVKERGGTTRSLGTPPVAVAAVVVRTEQNTRATWTVGGAAAFEEIWSDRVESAATPIFVVERTIGAAHAPPSAAEKAAAFAAFASYQALPSVAPYATRPEFTAAVFGHVYDRTDFDFYRAHPRALRVVNKPVDGISLQEARVRGDAFGATLEAKAKAFDREMEADFLEPGVWFSPHSRLDDGTIEASGDGALWTGTYIASQIYRFEVTGAPQAKINAKRSLDSLVKLQEITGDWTRFARTLRKSKAGVPASGIWHAGTGAFAGLDWLEGGNNDMIKGLFLGYALGFPFFCEGADKADHADLCARLRIAVDRLIDTNVAGSGGNALEANWLAATINGNLTRRLAAEQQWIQRRLELQAYAVEYRQGIADWSGTHLTFVGSLVDILLSSRMDLGGTSKQSVGDFIDRSQENLKDQRLVVWTFLRERFGKTRPAAQWIEDGKWRLREMPFPKPSIIIDHRVDPSFCMAPYPSLPWKNDWTTSDRSQALVSYPLFEGETNDMVWKNGIMGYRFDSRGRRHPGTDYLHLYWFGRRHGILVPGE
ncbi:MAG: hypothetical protein HOO96_26060 [Polyangiaceae bacterium]|nr:hypothetical protein [Polyangiaceae bacterium]